MIDFMTYNSIINTFVAIGTCGATGFMALQYYQNNKNKKIQEKGFEINVIKFVGIESTKGDLIFKNYEQSFSLNISFKLKDYLEYDLIIEELSIFGNKKKYTNNCKILIPAKCEDYEIIEFPFLNFNNSNVRSIADVEKVWFNHILNQITHVKIKTQIKTRVQKIITKSFSSVRRTTDASKFIYNPNTKKPFLYDLSNGKALNVKCDIVDILPLDKNKINTFYNL